jgi:hypothetical protein
MPCPGNKEIMSLDQRENSSCDNIAEVYANGENMGNSLLPPPMPLSSFRANPAAFATTSMPAVLEISSPPMMWGAIRQDAMQATSRPTFMRNSFSVLSSVAEGGDLSAKQALNSRIEEFEALLNDL